MGFLPTHFLPEALPATEGTALVGDEENAQYDGQEEGNHIQRVILVPGEVVGSRAQVRCALVPHDKLHPEHSQVQGLYGAILVQSGEPHDVFLVAKHRDKDA